MDKNLALPARIIRDDQSASQEQYTNADINIDLVVNARGRACMIHDRPFIGTPTWIKYLTNNRKVKILFDNGTEYVIDYIMDEKMHRQLLNTPKLFLIRIDNGKPIEAFDTNLLKE